MTRGANTRGMIGALVVALGAPTAIVWSGAGTQTQIMVIAASLAVAAGLFVGLRMGNRSAAALEARERAYDRAMAERLARHRTAVYAVAPAALRIADADTINPVHRAPPSDTPRTSPSRPPEATAPSPTTSSRPPFLSSQG